MGLGYLPRAWHFGWCPSIACIHEQRSDIDRSRVELCLKIACYVIAQQGFHGPRLVHDTRRHSGAIQFLSGMRLREANYLRPGRTSREAISALRPMARRAPSHDDWGRWRTPEHTPEGDRVPGLGRVQQTHALCIFRTRYRGTPPNNSRRTWRHREGARNVRTPTLHRALSPSQHAGGARRGSTVAPAAWHRFGATPRARTPQGPHTGGERPQALQNPCDTISTRRSSFRLPAMALLRGDTHQKLLI